ncbi:Cof-type HAD-IIB family hydrolase [Alkalihalobacillus sp. LMS6]|uniref:Cof-type HAD-IIB family hydrolase n=1 Tax=Alkalihalobacillus sp. LMS6 TaxID=2924034 RepID=UPI0020D1078A|nr:Cof-type HAD-IIB family hydrolase [Alkalihalobacillus sp. LMS6]UTR07068.1 Cof-type HAD-IIB family hydrolase [Alkalihalobacillus sp. LMS6]
MKYKVVFFDVDGTLTDHQTGEISASTRRAIRSLQRKQILVVAATGRPLSMCNELRDLGITTFITANGGLVTHHDEVIYHTSMSEKIVQAIETFAWEHQHALSFYSQGFHMNGVKNEAVHLALKETLSLTTYPSIRPIHAKDPIHLLCLFADEATEHLYKAAFPTLHFRRWHPYILNVLEENIDKALALKSVLRYFNMDQSQAVAFGDGHNDIDMLSFASIGVAMENGSEKLKQIANYVTKPASENGIELALKHFHLIE